MNIKTIGLCFLISLSACQQTLKKDVIVPMCPETMQQEEIRYKTNTFFARSGSGIGFYSIPKRLLCGICQWQTSGDKRHQPLLPRR
jgi:hypothetical protein